MMIEDEFEYERKLFVLNHDNPWNTYEYTFVDIEGTGGQDKGNEEILEFAAVKAHFIENKNYLYSKVINPGRPIVRYPWIKISNDELGSSPLFSQVKDEIEQQLDQCLFIAHNARVDYNLLKRKCNNIDNLIVLDTLKLSKKLFPELKGHKLIDLINLFDLSEVVERKTGSNIHRAMYDAYALVCIFREIMESKFSDGTLRDLIAICGLKNENKDFEQLEFF